MALKKPSELFGKKGDNSKISENINGNLNNIKQQFDKVEELKKELGGVTNSIDSLSEVVDNTINFVEFKEEYSEEIDKLNTKIQGIKEDFDDKIDELRAAHLTLNTEITRQANTIAFNNDFKLLMIIALINIPMVFLFKLPRKDSHT